MSSDHLKKIQTLLESHFSIKNTLNLILKRLEVLNLYIKKC
jgi:hypothetical protein